MNNITVLTLLSMIVNLFLIICSILGGKDITIPTILVAANFVIYILLAIFEFKKGKIVWSLIDLALSGAFGYLLYLLITLY